MERLPAEFVAEKQEEATRTGVLDLYLVRNLVSEDLLPFPVGIRTINLACTNVEWIPELPEGLQVLDCDKASLKRLPRLPSTLKELHIRRNRELNELPELPDSLEVLDMQETWGVEVLPKLPKSLRWLQIGVTSFREVLELPPNLEYFNAGFNMSRSGTGFLERLGPLPSSLKELHLAGNTRLTSIGALPEGLETLNIQGTGISVLPELPESLTTLYSQDTLYPEGCYKPEEIREWQGVAKKRTNKRCAAIKEELIAAVWHPRRMEFWSQQE